MSDELKPVPGYEGIYSITCEGRVWAHERIDYGCGYRRVYKGKWLKPGQLGMYLGVDLYHEVGKKRHFYLHHLVMMAWGPPQPSPKHEINHRDLNRHNNALSNLEWVTRAGNQRHAFVNGVATVTYRPGGANPQAKLTEVQVLEIRARYTGERGEQAALAREFGVSTHYVWSIINGQRWQHVGVTSTEEEPSPTPPTHDQN